MTSPYDVDALYDQGAAEYEGKPEGTLWVPSKRVIKTSKGPVDHEYLKYVGCTFPTKGVQVGKFSQVFFTATRGKHAGKPLVMRPHQQEVLDGIYRLDPATGKRLVRTAILQAPRKWGKSNIAAPVALHSLVLGNGDGIGETYGLAGDRKQASLVFSEVKKIVQANEELSKLIKVYRDALEVVGNTATKGSVYRTLSADAGLAQGLNPSCAVADEIGTWYGTDLWYAMTQAVAARPEPLLLGISTPGWDKGSLYGQLTAYGTRVNTGEQEDASFYYRTFEPADPFADWKDIQTWAEANPGLGDYLEVEFFENTIKSVPEHEFRRFNLAQWVSTSSAWIDSADWKACEDPLADIEEGEEVWVGFDGSYNNDSTAISIATRDGRVAIALRANGRQCIWEKPAVGSASWKVPIKDVEAAMAEVCARYDVQLIGCDPYRWERSMQMWEEEGLPVIKFANSSARMVAAGNRFEQSVRAGTIRHTGESVLSRHFMNCGIKTDWRGSRPVKQALTSKIDAAIAAVMAYDLSSATVEAAEPEYSPQVINLF